jgi:hypothetical protein
MSIPLDRLYHYIENIAKEVRGDDVIIYRFYPHGSKNIDDLKKLGFTSWLESRILQEIICYDQEPLAYDLYCDIVTLGGETFTSLKDPKNLLPKRNIRRTIGNIHDKCLLLHSEKRSPDVEKYQADNFIPVYYWSHGMISRDWFRYAKFETFKKTPSKTFLIYNRAWSGTREYRIKFVDLLIEHKLVDFCQTTFNPIEPESGSHYQLHQYKNTQWVPQHDLEQYFDPTYATAESSADFNTTDYNSTEFEIVLETLFDDARLHLTEKSLRPIACCQPFVLVATHGSLKYLRSYGFRTFDSVIDETYDDIIDPYQRMQAVINTMKQITAWSESDRLKNTEKIKKITEFNQQHFFSDAFFNIVQSELKNNLSRGFEELELTNTCQEFLKLDRHLMKDPVFRQTRKPWRLKNITKQDQITVLNKIKYYRQKNKKNFKG